MTFNKITQAIIFCGGKGTRAGKVTDKTPKPLIIINNKPFLYHLIKKLENEGVKEVILLTGYLNIKFEKFIVKYNKEFKLDIKISYLDEKFETYQRIKNIEDQLLDRFYILYGDNYWDGNFSEHKSLLSKYDLVTTAYNTRFAERGNLNFLDKTKKIRFSETRKKDFKYLDMGFMISNKKSMVEVFKKHNENLKFSDIVFKELIKNNKLGLHTSFVRHKSIGTPEGINSTRKYLKDKKFIFLDRDGVLNEKPKKADYVKQPEEFIWKSGSIEGLKYLTDKKYKIILISNQPGIARGKMSKDDLSKINKKIISDSISKKIKIYDMFYCLHNWDEQCFCRKPEPGLLIEAQDKYNIQLSNSYFIGDDERDIEAGKKVYTNTVKINRTNSLLDVLLKLEL
tara:strand:- start:2604 stop:3794 length:1191 start_codon:yes stop_codon:yes gene_type:complete